MRGMTIAWRDEPFRCEFRGEAGGGWLHVLQDGELLAREPVASVVAAYQRAKEISRALLWKGRRGA